MSMKDYVDMFGDMHGIHILKNKGYTMIDRMGEDGVVDTFYKKIGVEKSIAIGKYTYPIVGRKKLQKYGMPYFRFNASAFGEDKTGKCTITNVDGDTFQEIVRKARLVGQNSTAGNDKMIMFLALGGIIGILIGWIIKTMMGA